MTGTLVADAKGVTAPLPKQTQNAKAKPTIEKLFIYATDVGKDEDGNRSKLFAERIRNAYYPNAKMESVDDWNQLVAVLSRYSEIKSLILFTHSIPGELLIGGEAPTKEDQQRRLASTGVKVTQGIFLEGCSSMKDPITASFIFSAIAGQTTQLQGYTYFGLANDVTVEIPKDATEKIARTQIEPHKLFLLPNQPAAKDIAAKPGKHIYVQRWFRPEIDDPPIKPPPLAPGTLPPRDFVLQSSLARRSIATAAQAKAALTDFSQPVFSAEVVTVTDIATVAKTEP